MKNIKNIFGMILLLLLSHCSNSCHALFGNESYYNVKIHVWGEGGASVGDIKWEVQGDDEHQSYLNRPLPWSKQFTRIFDGQVCVVATNKSGVGSIHVKFYYEFYIYDEELYQSDDPATEEDEASGGYVKSYRDSGFYYSFDPKTASICDYY